MALSSEYLTLLNEVVSQVQGLKLTFNYPTPIGNQAVPVLLKKVIQAIKGPALNQLPIIWVVHDPKPYNVTPWTTEDEVLAKYNVTVMVIEPGIQDKTNTQNLDIWLNWDQQTRRLFQWGLQPTIPNCFFAEVVMNPPILRDQSLKGYDVDGVGLRLWNVEQRTN